MTWKMPRRTPACVSAENVVGLFEAAQTALGRRWWAAGGAWIWSRSGARDPDMDKERAGQKGHVSV